MYNSFTYQILQFSVGACYLLSSLIFLHLDKAASDRDGLSGHKFASTNPADTLRALKRIWGAKYRLLGSPGMAILMYISRITLVIFIGMVLYFLYFMLFIKG